MNIKGGEGWKIYHLTQPYFFAHHHFHLRKIQALRCKGMDAQLLSFVPRKLYLSHEKQYREIERELHTKIIVLPSERLYFIYFIYFLLFNVISGNKIFVHVLRSSTWPIIFLKKIPLIRNKLRLVQEFEGDSVSEINYSNYYNNKYIKSSSIIKKLKKVKLLINLKKEVLQVESADGVVLMSREHLALWETRINKKLTALVLPTLPDPNEIIFDVRERDIIRDQLNIKNNLVFVYVGNIVSPWQRRDDMCEFISKLKVEIPNLKFLALVRQDDIPLMKSSISKYEIADVTILKSVPHCEIYKYLSASDLAVFLRHNHTMNNIVTSGKLGEYICSGLPVLTTGNNAEILNDFIKRNNAGLFIDENLKLSTEFLNELNNFNGIKIEVRNEIRDKYVEEFVDQENCFEAYPKFIQNVMLGECA